MNTGLLPLTAAGDPGSCGAKAANLSTALRAGLPVPDGVVLEPGVVRMMADSDPAADRWLADLTALAAAWNRPLAVRSSAVGQDGDAANFAGQHVTRLGVRATNGALRAAITAVHTSAAAPNTLAHRNPLQRAASREIAVLVQPLVAADVSGVLFTQDPVTGADALVVEAARGLGDTVVGGLVTPDRYRIRGDGTITERRPGRQPVAIVAASGGGTDERVLEPRLADTPCLDDDTLAALSGLAARCTTLFDRAALEIAWAFASQRLWLLQCQPATTS